MLEKPWGKTRIEMSEEAEQHIWERRRLCDDSAPAVVRLQWEGDSGWELSGWAKSSIRTIINRKSASSRFYLDFLCLRMPVDIRHPLSGVRSNRTFVAWQRWLLQALLGAWNWGSGGYFYIRRISGWKETLAFWDSMLLEDLDKMVLAEVCCSYDSSLQLHSDFSFEIQTTYSTIYMKSPFGGLLGKSNLTCPEHNSQFLHLCHPQTLPSASWQMAFNLSWGSGPN